MLGFVCETDFLQNGNYCLFRTSEGSVDSVRRRYCNKHVCECVCVSVKTISEIRPRRGNRVKKGKQQVHEVHDKDGRDHRVHSLWF